MTGRALKPTLFVPIDIKVREFRSKLLVASEAAARGMRVYIGTKSAITTALRARDQRAGVYFSKGGDSLEVLGEARQRCDAVVAQDEEVGPALSRQEVAHYWSPPRYSAGAIEAIDRLFVYSEVHRAVVAEVAPALAAKATVTGWPRVDLWRQQMRGPEGRVATQLRERFGSFVLFVGNYKVSTEQQRDRKIDFGRQEHERVPLADRSPSAVYDEFGTNATHRLASLRKAAATLVALAEQLPATTFVLRPHPAEDPEAWRALVAGASNIQVVYEGEVGPWILASQAMLHTGCTTAVQASHYGVPHGYLAEVGYLADTFSDTVSYRLATHLADVDEARRFLTEVRPATGGLSKLIGDEEMGPTDGRSAARIADGIAALGVTGEPPVKLPTMLRVKRTLGGRWRERGEERGAKGDSFFGTAAQPKVPGGLHASEARALLAELPGTDQLTVTEPLFNLLAIESS